MQTFLAFPSFDASARVLDDKRLGKQRVECLQIMSALLTGKGWIHHPATKMWTGIEHRLLDYTWVICDEWTQRGHADTVREKITMLFDYYKDYYQDYPDDHIWWLGDPIFHMSHRSNLYRKDPIHYKQFRDEPGHVEYLWPSPNPQDGWSLSAAGAKRVKAGELLDPREVTR